MDDLADQLMAAMDDAAGYSEMASAFHPELRERTARLVGAPRVFPDVQLWADQLGDLPTSGQALHEELVRNATSSPAPYVVWARYPDINWPVPMGWTPTTITRVLSWRYADRCNWCTTPGAANDALLVTAGCAVALFSFCAFCRLALSDECRADLHWVDLSAPLTA